MFSRRRHGDAVLLEKKKFKGGFTGSFILDKKESPAASRGFWFFNALL
jgi:hypothetical protein